MSDFDVSDLDGRLLQLLVTVHQEGSITRAAARLGVTQSAVSHLLDKLRAIVGDPLFVKSGRGIAATERAEALAPRARALLEELRAFAQAGAFDPGGVDTVVTVAANDLQRDLLLPRLLAAARARAPGLRLRVIPSGAPDAGMLREERCQLLITPRPPDASDLIHKRLFEDRYRVFHDAAARGAPSSLDEYLAAEHVTVLYEPWRQLDIDQLLHTQGLARRFVATVPGFAGIPGLLRGTPWLATLPSLLGAGLLNGFASSEPPMPCPPMPMYAVWHLRRQGDPMHQWLRALLDQVVPQALNDARE
jgi:DNA-binding transcriptional LysR family regulator